MKLFLTSNASEVLDKIVPMLPKAPDEMVIAFVPTAADPYETAPWMEADRNKLVELGFTVYRLDIKDKTEEEIRDDLLDTDIIFAAGGNSFYLLEKARKSGFDKVATELIKKGKIYIGSSAGSVITGPNIEPVKIFDNPDEARLNSTKGLGWVDFIVLPHFGNDKYASLHKTVMKEFGDKFKILPISDDQMIVVDDDKYEII